MSASHPLTDVQPPPSTISIQQEPAVLNDQPERPESSAQHNVEPSHEPMTAAQTPFHYEQMYPPPLHLAPRSMHLPTSGPPQTWQAPNGMMPRMVPPHPPMMPRPLAGSQPPAVYRHDVWSAYYHSGTYHPMMAGPSQPPYEHRYRDEQTGWIAAEYPEHHVRRIVL